MKRSVVQYTNFIYQVQPFFFSSPVCDKKRPGDQDTLLRFEHFVIITGTDNEKLFISLMKLTVMIQYANGLQTLVTLNI